MSRSEEHTSELQSPYDLVCRLLLEKKKRMILYEPYGIHNIQRTHLVSLLVVVRDDSGVERPPGVGDHLSVVIFFFLMIRRPPRSTLFPYNDALPISSSVIRNSRSAMSHPQLLTQSRECP